MRLVFVALLEGETSTGWFGQNSALPQPGDTSNAWTGQMYSAAGSRTLTVYVLCASP